MDTFPSHAFVETLREMARGDATVGRATVAVRGALAQGLDEEVYDGFRDLTWRLIASHVVGPELSSWFDLLRHASSQARRRSNASLAERLRTLCDLLGQSSRSKTLKPAEDVTGRKHVVWILRALGESAVPVPRETITAGLGLKNANLSRILAILLDHGLVQRTKSGKEALFALTEKGTAAACRQNVGPPPDVGDWSVVPVAMAVFEGDGSCLLATDAFRRFFVATLEAPRLEDWRSLIGHGRRDWVDVQLGRRWVEATEKTADDGRCFVVAHDVTRRKRLAGALARMRSGPATARKAGLETAPKLIARLK